MHLVWQPSRIFAPPLNNYPIFKDGLKFFPTLGSKFLCWPFDCCSRRQIISLGLLMAIINLSITEKETMLILSYDIRPSRHVHQGTEKAPWSRVLMCSFKICLFCSYRSMQLNGSRDMRRLHTQNLAAIYRQWQCVLFRLKRFMNFKFLHWDDTINSSLENTPIATVNRWL